MLWLKVSRGTRRNGECTRSTANNIVSEAVRVVMKASRINSVCPDCFCYQDRFTTGEGMRLVRLAVSVGMETPASAYRDLGAFEESVRVEAAVVAPAVGGVAA